MKLLDRTHGKHAAEHALDAEHQELLDQLEVPDDLSGLHKVPSIGEDGHDDVAEPRRAALMVRWLGWVSVYLLAMAGLIAGLVMLTDVGESNPVTPTVETPNWEIEGPGSNSLLIPMAAEVGWTTGFEGPGGGTMSQIPVLLIEPEIASQMTIAEWSQVYGPGSNSVGTTPSPVPWSFDTEGPGSNSPTIPTQTR